MQKNISNLFPVTRPAGLTNDEFFQGGDALASSPWVVHTDSFIPRGQPNN